MAEPGPVGGGVAAVASGSPLVIETKSDHGLADGDRVRMSNRTDPDKPFLAYVKASGYATNKFALFTDSPPTQAALITGDAIAADTPIDCLAQRDRAIVIGIDTYPEFTTLAGPTRDADDFAAWVKSGAGGCVPDDQVKVVKSPVFRTPPRIETVVPTLREVAREFQDLANLANRSDLNYLGRRLYIFMSGHGILPTRAPNDSWDEAALLMPDSRVGVYPMHVGGRSHAEWFRVRGIFKEVILFMDCCRDLEDEVPLLAPMLPAIQPHLKPGRRFYAAGAQLGAKSWEKDFGGTTRGVFSYVLLNALRNEALSDSQGRLTGRVLYSDLHANIPKVMDNQAPDISYQEAEDIVFLKRRLNRQRVVQVTVSSQSRCTARPHSSSATTSTTRSITTSSAQSA